MSALIIGTFIRHALTSVGGALVAKGILEASMVNEIIGAVSTLVGVALSLVQKYRNK